MRRGCAVPVALRQLLFGVRNATSRGGDGTPHSYQASFHAIVVLLLRTTLLRLHNGCGSGNPMAGWWVMVARLVRLHCVDELLGQELAPMTREHGCNDGGGYRTACLGRRSRILFLDTSPIFAC